MKEIDITKIDDVELCKEHSKWWGKAMYHACAEGQAWFSERTAGAQAERECEKIEKEFKNRDIDFCWKTIYPILEDGREGTGSLKHCYTKNGETILID